MESRFLLEELIEMFWIVCNNLPGTSFGFLVTFRQYIDSSHSQSTHHETYNLAAAVYHDRHRLLRARHVEILYAR